MNDHSSSSSSPSASEQWHDALRRRLKFEAAFGMSHVRRGRARPVEPWMASHVFPPSTDAPTDAPVSDTGPQETPSPPPSPLVPSPPPAVPASVAPSPSPAPAVSAVPIVAVRETVPDAEAVRDGLERLAAEVAECRACAELVRNRTQTVFADGNPFSPVVFVGEAPGESEDLQGKPFVGPAGKKLTDIIEKGFAAVIAKELGVVDGPPLKRSDVYICNVLKCRPPGNRTPYPDEVERCRGFLRRQLGFVQPLVICALGLPALQRLTGSTSTMGQARGKRFQFVDDPEIIVIPTYHPSYLLRSPSKEMERQNSRKVFEDIIEVAIALRERHATPWWPAASASRQ